jgi:methenyltetrahydromethanopterin cyclohydrolase
MATMAHLYSLVGWLKMQILLLPPLLFTTAAQEALAKVKVDVHNAIGADPSRTECSCLLMHFFRQASQVHGNKNAKRNH